MISEAKKLVIRSTVLQTTCHVVRCTGIRGNCFVCCNVLSYKILELSDGLGGGPPRPVMEKG